MDTLVFMQFDFKKRLVLEKLEEDVSAKDILYNKHGVYGSGEHIREISKLYIQSASDIVNSLLSTYEEVGRTIEEEIVITKEAEIRAETERLALEEGERVRKDVNKISGAIIPEKMEFFTSNFLSDSRNKVEIFIGTTKRKLGNRKPKKSFS